jgi:hypothetical protein
MYPTDMSHTHVPYGRVVSGEFWRNYPTYRTLWRITLNVPYPSEGVPTLYPYPLGMHTLLRIHKRKDTPYPSYVHAPYHTHART